MPGTSARRVRADVHRAAEQQAMNTKRGRMTTVIRRSAQAAVLVAVAIGLSGCSYNTFTTQEEAIKAQWAQVQNQIQRRNDLIPNLVETVKGYATHEESVFKEIADSRSKLLAAKSPEEVKDEHTPCWDRCCRRWCRRCATRVSPLPLVRGAPAVPCAADMPV